MSFAFWEWMIQRSLGDAGLPKNDRVPGPHQAREFFGVEQKDEDGPIWTFDRMGASRNRLPDGRIVYIGGEHEDFYDPDFCIYNDVVVLKPANEIQIYGYPKEVFPPTDFHTATLVHDRIVVIGTVGYQGTRRLGHTPVYALDLATYRISEVKTSGDMPGWISEHRASLDMKGVIKVRRGRVLHFSRGKERFRPNYEDYALDTKTWVWNRLTNRNWREFSIRQEKGAFIGDGEPKPEALFPRGIEHDVMPHKKDESARIIVEGVPVSLTIDIARIRVLIEGDMPEVAAGRLAEAIRERTEAAIKRPCILERA
jgi:hypothetical protein